ncbi:hypothetical protein I0P70_02545 [Pontibacter sp. FD36]|uniref:hypothetical protein n=1 Tax=Pontibacter sp. FD36 TaxID=2789860 RepID=UPI0018A99340|nr:hypothetical protein [Pontibacter sp. FD36]MBF8962113.1 hypothetical protein [Pontibacter sp. FD36]
MRTKLLFLLTFSPVLLSSLSGCDSGYSNSHTSYEEAKLTLEEQERMYPSNFLSTDGTHRKNLLGEWVMEGTVKSTASVATYKDVELAISYYSKTETLLGTERQTVYDYFRPGAKVKYKLKSYGIKGAKKIGVEVINALPAN